MHLTDSDILSMFRWSNPEITQTKHGVRWRREAPAVGRDIRTFNEKKIGLMPAGVTLGEWPPYSGKYKLTWWKRVSPEEEERHVRAINLSEAAHADLHVPSPRGLAYYPFQRASVHFILNGMGVDCAALLPGTKPDPRAFKGLFGLPMLPVEVRRTGFAINDEMGLGKSVQAVALINAINAIGGGKRLGKILYVCPGYLKINAALELSKWLVEKYSIGIADGRCFPSADIVVINFQILKKWEPHLSQMWDLMIVDEAHTLRNAKAVMTQVAYGVEASRTSPAKSGIPAKLRIAMTGTPAANRPREIWQMIRWLDPDTWNNYSKFAWRYCGGGGPNGWTDKGVSNAAELQHKLKSTILIRRLKADVLKELPPKNRQVILLPNNMGESVNFDHGEMKDWGIRMARAKATMEIAKTMDDPDKYTATQQALMDAVDSGMAATSRLRLETARSKIDDCLAILRNALEQEEKIVVCAYHQEICERIAKEFPNSVLIYGAVDPAKRHALVSRFQTDPNCNMAVLSIPTAVGMTLTAASTVYFVEESWIPGEIAQAEDRVHRIGQRDAVNVIHCLVRDSIELLVAEQNIRKQKMLDAVFDENEDRGREAMEPVIPLPGFSATIREVAVQSLKPMDQNQVRERAREYLKVATGVNWLLADTYVGCEKPWVKFTAMIHMMLEAEFPLTPASRDSDPAGASSTSSPAAQT